MYCLFLLCASLYISLPHTCVCLTEDDALPFKRIIQDYYKSESVGRLRKDWETVRKSYEHALVTIMKDSIGSIGMNMYIRKPIGNKIADGYFHNDNQVLVIFLDLNLEAIPLCLYPDVKFTLASNVLKINTILSKMIIHADYALLRNKTDIIHDPEDQDPYKSSPFLFEQVPDIGKVAISMEGCELKGFLTLEIDFEQIDFRHDRFKMHNCVYDIEIYKPGNESPPVMARYNMSDYNQGLSLADLLKKPLVTYSLVPKLLSAIYSTINTTAIFGYNNLRKYRENVRIVLLLTMNKLADMVRQMNKLTVEKNQGAIEMADYEVYWDDGRKTVSNVNEAGTGVTLRLTGMVLTGLDTLYSAHKGGPFQFDTVRIADKLRFSSLQVRGKVEIISTSSDLFDFSAEISDLTMDLHIELSESKNTSQGDSWIKDRKLEVESIRKMTVTLPTLLFASAESLISGHLLKEVPKLINVHSMDMFDQAAHEHSKTKPPNQETPEDDESQNEFDGLVLPTDYEYPKSELENAIFNIDNTSSEKIKRVREKDMLKKSMKRFKSSNRPRRRRGRTFGKRVAQNEIRNK